MPDIESLMQEWPPEFEELLKRVGLPTADMNCDLDQYVDMVCATLDIPIYQSRIQALHVLFTLYSEFKNSQVRMGFIFVFNANKKDWIYQDFYRLWDFLFTLYSELKNSQIVIIIIILMTSSYVAHFTIAFQCTLHLCLGHWTNNIPLR